MQSKGVCVLNILLLSWSHADVVLLFSHSTQPVRAVNLGYWLDPMPNALDVLARSQDVRAWNSLLYYWFDDMLTVLHVFYCSQSVSACDSLLIWPFLMCFPVHRAYVFGIHYFAADLITYWPFRMCFPLHSAYVLGICYWSDRISCVFPFTESKCLEFVTGLTVSHVFPLINILISTNEDARGLAPGVINRNPHWV